MSIAKEVEEGSLCAIPLAGETLEIHVDIVLPREGYRPLAVDSFLTSLTKRG